MKDHIPYKKAGKIINQKDIIKIRVHKDKRENAIQYSFIYSRDGSIASFTIEIPTCDEQILEESMLKEGFLKILEDIKIELVKL